jgi:hypothetical protein
MTSTTPLDDETRLLVVIVNYRTPHLAIAALQSLVDEVQTVPGTSVTVVDNNSADGSVDMIRAAIDANDWGSWASLLPSSINGGFAFGNNFAIRPALQSANPPSYVLLLNPDTQVRPGALKALIDFMQQNPKAGIAGSSFEEADGSPWPFAFRFPNILNELDSGLRLGIVSKLLAQWALVRDMDDQNSEVDWMPGASMMIRREVFETAGLMDEGYFLYYEETDFCLQAKRAGWSCWYVPQSRVMHLVGQSTGVTVKTDRPKRLPKYWFDSRRRYFMKNHGWLYAVLADIVWLVGFTLWRFRRVIQRKPDPDPPQLWGDFIRNSVLFNKGIPSQELQT